MIAYVNMALYYTGIGRTVWVKEGRQCYSWAWASRSPRSLIKMIIRDMGQKRKRGKTVRSEKCLGGWEQTV